MIVITRIELVTKAIGSTDDRRQRRHRRNIEAQELEQLAARELDGLVRTSRHPQQRDELREPPQQRANPTIYATGCYARSRHIAASTSSDHDRRVCPKRTRTP
jgi:hypothetical protein